VTKAPERAAADAKLLLVDDEAAVCEVLSIHLQRAGYSVSTCDTAEEGLEILRREQISTAVVDISLPGMSGLEFARLLADDPNMIVVLMTGYDQDYSYETAIHEGASDFIVKPVRAPELQLRIERAQRARRLELERDRFMHELQRLAITDSLTGLFNARHFSERLDSEIDRARRYGRSLSLVMLDIDRFKEINDRHGHAEGDRALAEFGRLLSDSIRRTDSAFRYGGEEFTILLPETDLDAAVAVADKIRDRVASEKLCGDVHEPLTVSAGVTTLAPAEDADAFLQRADEALYRSKDAGRNRVSHTEAPPARS